MGKNHDFIDLHTVSAERYLPLSKRALTVLCADRVFKTAFKPGKGGRGSKWLVSRAEIIQHRINGHPNPDY